MLLNKKRETATRNRLIGAVSRQVLDITSGDPELRGQAREILRDLSLATTTLNAICAPTGEEDSDVRVGGSE